MLQRQQRLELGQRVGLVQRLVVADPQHAREAHGDAALVARAAVDAFEAELEHQRRPDAAHRAELLERGLADDAVDDAGTPRRSGPSRPWRTAPAAAPRRPAARAARSPRSPPPPRPASRGVRFQTANV